MRQASRSSRGCARAATTSRASARRGATWAAPSRSTTRSSQTYADNGRARFNLAQIRRARGDRRATCASSTSASPRRPEFGGLLLYLAREELDAGRLDPAADLAKRGLEAQPRSDTAPLGHFVLADVYSRRGEAKQAEEEAAKGRKLEATLGKNPSPRI